MSEPQEAPRATDFSTLASYALLALSTCYAFIAGGALQYAWEALLLPLMVGEYVFALGTSLMMNVRSNSARTETHAMVTLKGLLAFAIWLAPFLWFVVAGMWKAAPLLAAGYLVTIGARAWSIASASAGERERMRRRITPPIYAFLASYLFFILLAPSGWGVAWGPAYFVILAACEAYNLRTDTKASRPGAAT